MSTAAPIPAPVPATATTGGWERLPCTLGDTPAARAAIGVIVLASDLTIETEMRTFLPVPGVGIYGNRIVMPHDATLETLRRMESDMARCAQLLVPDNHLDVIAFGCTSGTMAIGAERVAELIREARPGTAISDPISASLKGLARLGCGRIALITPYIDEINEVVEGYIAGKGLDIAVKGSFKQRGDPEMCRISPESIYEAGMKLGSTDVDALFISCTALRVSPVIGALERDLGKPVVSSNQALSWDCLRQSGCDDAVEGFGRLLTL